VHAGRKAFTNTKSIAIDFFGMSAKIAGGLDACFMLAYAVGLVALGSLGDKHNPVHLLLISLIGMASMQSVFVELTVRGYAESSAGLGAIYLVWIMNGLIQSLAWPCCIKLVQSYLNGDSRGTTIFSFWACNGILGNIVSSLVAGMVMGKDTGIERLADFRNVFLVTTCMNLVVMLAVARLPSLIQPKDEFEPGVELGDQGEGCVQTSARVPIMTDHGEIVEAGVPTQQPVQVRDESVMSTLKIRGVIDYSLCHLCIKGVAYAMFFWLPFYLIKAHKVEPGTAASLSIVYDIATLIGGPICGFLVELSKKPATIICVAVLLAAGPQFLINGSGDDGFGGGHTSSRMLLDTGATIPYQVIINIIVSGFFVGGVLNVLSAAICASIGGHSAARVTGIIDGFGSLGASATQLVIPMIGVENGWGAVFGMLGGLLILSALTLVRMVRDEFTYVVAN